MTHRINLVFYKTLFIFLCVLFSCKNENLNASNNKNNSTKLVTESAIEPTKNSNSKDSIPLTTKEKWSYHRVIPISESTHCNAPNLSLELSNDSIYMENQFIGEVYSGNVPVRKYLKYDYLYSTYQKILKNELSIDLPDNVNYIRNKNPNSKLKNIFVNAFFIDEYMFIERDGCIVVLKKNSELFSQTDTTKNTHFDKIYNKKLVGLSEVNPKENNPYKKYGLDFASECYCDSPSMYIDTQKNEIIIFNYCEPEKEWKAESEKMYTYSITNSEFFDNSMILSTNNKLKFTIRILNQAKDLYQISIQGSLPKSYVGQQLKSIFTSKPSNFVQYDCGDFDG